MKIFTYSLSYFVIVCFLIGCNQSVRSKKNETIAPAADTIIVPDTGYTGIKQYKSGIYIIKEVTFKNGVREGLMKTFYQNGKLRQTFWYQNGLREDSSKWFYESGEVFRSTPYRHDTVEGIQKQYYRNGKLKAKLNYKKGLRTFSLEEYSSDGKLVSGYPSIEVTISDRYHEKGTLDISLSMSDKSTKVKFYRYEGSPEVYDTVLCKKINTTNGIGIIKKKKTEVPTSNTIGIVSEMITNFGNNYLIYKKIDLPYNDLK
jgi:antitoxin component YwqK of YwqJK toxin-antitoxin module